MLFPVLGRSRPRIVAWGEGSAGEVRSHSSFRKMMNKGAYPSKKRVCLNSPTEHARLTALSAVTESLYRRAREATRSALPGGGYFFLVYSRATGSLAQVAGSADRVA